MMQQYERCDITGNWVYSQYSLDKRVSRSTQLQHVREGQAADCHVVVCHDVVCSTYWQSVVMP